jgi:predicted choloylglycine hydrolase
MGEVLLCQECHQPVNLKQKNVVTNRATARTHANRVYAHLSCVVGRKKSVHDMSDMELEAAIAELDRELGRKRGGMSATVR